MTATATATTTAAERLHLWLEISELQARYTSALDNDQLEAWTGFFTEDCRYEIIPKENVDAGLPAPVVKALNDAIVEALALPDVKDKLVAAGFTPRGSTPDEFAQLTRTEYRRLGDVAKKAGMTAD